MTGGAREGTRAPDVPPGRHGADRVSGRTAPAAGPADAPVAVVASCALVVLVGGLLLLTGGAGVLRTAPDKAGAADPQRDRVLLPFPPGWGPPGRGSGEFPRLHAG